MANTNSENPRIGREFQDLVQSIVEKRYCIPFEQEATIPIGKPPKKHKYDLASIDRSIVVECKCYTWTDSGNVPSAKLMGMNEAMLAPGENRHFEPGENNQFQPGRNRQSVPGGCSQPRFECRF